MIFRSVLASFRAARGGSWFLGPWYPRAAHRGSGAPGYRSGSLGVRLVRRVS
jgi:formylglycine-generating enzyme required for sulfatase activity